MDEEVFGQDIKADKMRFVSPDTAKLTRMREMGYSAVSGVTLLDFTQLLSDTNFPLLYPRRILLSSILRIILNIC